MGWRAFRSVIALYRGGPASCGSTGSFVEDLSEHVIGDIGHTDLHRRLADANRANKELHLAFFLAKTCWTADPIFDRRPLARGIVFGIGWPLGFRWWMFDFRRFE